jgi:hypothetical protein
MREEMQMAYQTFQVNKTGSTLNVTFNPPFAKPPIVIVTSSMMGATRMDSVETVTAISTTGATIVSGNNASNYFVNVLAIDVDDQSVNGVPVIAGSAQKTGHNVNIPLTQPPLPSVNLVSPFWQGSNGAVGGVETVTAETSSGITVGSGNAASNYFTEYLDVAPSDSAGVQAGIVNKQGTVQRVYFTRQWLTPPYVFVSPWYTSGVGNVEFITAVTDAYFEVTSGNSASNYFVSWLAVPGPNASFSPPTGAYTVTVNDGGVTTQGTLTLTVLPGSGRLAPTAMWAHPSTSTPVEVPVGWDGTNLTWIGSGHIYGPGTWNGSQFSGSFQHRNGHRGKRTNGAWTAAQHK